MISHTAILNQERTARALPTATRLAYSGASFNARVLPWILPAVGLILWQAAAVLDWTSPQILPAPALVAKTLFDLARDGDLAAALLVSGRRIAIGFFIGVALGLPFGALLGVSRRAEAYLGPLFRAFAAVPTLGWLPILILIFGLDEMLKYVIIAKACFVPVALNTSLGIRNIPQSYREVASVFGLRKGKLLTKLLAPATLPSIFTGLRLAVSSAWIALIVVEMLAATEGVGYMMTWGRTLFQIDIVIAGMIIIGVIGLSIDVALRAVERRIDWRTACGG